MTIIASTGDNGEIGREGDLCWHIREDLRHFKQLTLGGAVAMGRATWESLPTKPLPGRLNIVLTRSAGFKGEGAVKAASLAEAIQLAEGRSLFVIGGESVYREAMPMARRLEITRIMAADPRADKFFPYIDPNIWVLKEESEIMTSPEGLRFQFLTYENSCPVEE